MICGLTVPDSGSVEMAGGVSLAFDEAGHKSRIGLVLQDIALYEDLPARLNVEVLGAPYGMAPDCSSAALTNCWPWWACRTGPRTASHGA